jgi:hypothetical protein
MFELVFRISQDFCVYYYYYYYYYFQSIYIKVFVIIVYILHNFSLLLNATNFNIGYPQFIILCTYLRQYFSLLHSVQTGFGVHPTSYPMGTGGSFPRGKAAGA